MRVVRIRLVVNPRVFPEVKVSEPPKCSSLPCPRRETKNGHKVIHKSLERLRKIYEKGMRQYYYTNVLPIFQF